MIQSDNSKRAAGADEARVLRSYYSDPAPIGDGIIATLKGKSWGRAVNLICYFTDEKTGANFSISVFRSRKDGESYCADDQNVDFSEPNIVGKSFKLDIQKSPRAKFPKLTAAKVSLK
ncbi:hypothetical protein CL635_03290 [bacterium]|nr:hypothetical protein [bacterium]|tara:strand:- start:764 stop:1117 length:354 start_codon:yes stop_codon:yes gene_type:complete